MAKTPKKKKTDFAALNSPFMRIPGMRVEGARALLDLGNREIYQLRGRDPNSLWEDLKKKRVIENPDIRRLLEIAVEFADSED